MHKTTKPSGEKMASGEEAGRPSVSPSSVGLEALFTAEAAGRADGDGSPELAKLRERLQGWLWQYEPAVLWAQRLLVWERPLQSICVAFALNTAFWLLSSTPLRPIFLISVSLISLVLLERWKDKLPSIPVHYPDSAMPEREGMTVRPRLLGVPELSHHLAETYFTFTLYVQEMLLYKRQNHGKFCALMCASCLVLAVLGHYVPGIMISYIILLSVLLWPLVVYHELIQKMYTGLEPVLMKLDYSMKGEERHHKHDKRKVKKESEDGSEPQAETESESEGELSCFTPTVDVKTTALAMAITDSELSDEEASILESGGFSVSRATTPQLSDVSEDLDQQSLNSEAGESLSRDLPESPAPASPGPNHGTAAGPQNLPQSPESLLIRHLASPLHFVNTHFNGHGEVGAPTLGLSEVPRGPNPSLEALSEEIVNTAISAVVQGTLRVLLSSSESPPADPEPGSASTDDGTAKRDESPLPTTASAHGPDEDFELLDQSELESTDGDQSEISVGPETEAGVTPATPPPSPRRQES
ncbi:reticulophagy regulator 2-like [Brienomyrus brachyistius]|uniref:reticulophagy regulator 2-like n=1 Tax=Brienomyrus brachyistius TaxID=42636 RepID=UPI0020B2AF06|nr:reticulophagy regulator 2-like [Brienomyrus brachyistius]